jgi:hypothetical protein
MRRDCTDGSEILTIYDGHRSAEDFDAQTKEKGVAGTTRLELATSAVTGQRSNQLNYVPTEGNASLGGH